MPCSAKKCLFSSLLGLLLVVVGPACAWAQSDWQTQPTNATQSAEGYTSADASPFPAARALRPLDTSPNLPSPPALPSVDPGVVRAGYEMPVGGASLDLAPRQPPTADTGSATSEDSSRQTLRRAAAPGLLPRRSTPSSTTGGRPNGLAQLWTTGAALALVLGLFLVVMWTVRRAAPKTLAALPAEVVETLGRAPLAGRQYVHLVRCGQKLLLVNVTADGAKTLTEIDDPVEVDRLAALCQQSRPGAAAAFRQVFEQFSYPSRQRAADEREYSASSLFDDDRASLLEDRDV